MNPDLIVAAEAYRSERRRYWIRRKKFGEVTTPGGSTAVIATQVEHQDGTVLFCGSDDEAKVWLDRTCLSAAMTKLLRDPTTNLIERAGSAAVLASIADYLIPQE